ncbi:MAG: phosphoadenosine phosphosulfate reductase family protein, partial [Rhodanobacteraceae bacterium]|nr:phosphoadenosine phosphosulfate reductase family protein [Rhodanobacteraceae bacterium]
MKTIRIPDQVRERKPVLSLSGGKDSVAASLAMREAGVPHIMVFADTGWESPITYQHLSDLERLLGPIERVGVPGGMVGKIRSRAGFPARLQRWCTTELK